jgi:CheY-like chemotaxis protein
MVLTILVADDSRVESALLCTVLKKAGYRTVAAFDGTEAVAAFNAQRPDIVLMDGIMPVMDGFAATAEIKRLSGDRWVPVVMISGLNETADVVRGIEAGADDFLSKPLNHDILAAKLKQLQKAIEARGLAQQQQALLDKEAQLAADLIHRMIRAEGLKDPLLRWRSTPVSLFSGDLVLANRSPGGSLYVLHADAVGHGLTAAVCLLPILRIFYTMSEKDMSVGVMAYEMNRHLNEMLPVGHYVAATLISINESEREVRAWNGGMPPICLVEEQGQGLHLRSSPAIRRSASCRRASSASAANAT